MFQCPHCRKTIEIAASQKEPVPWHQYDPGNGVSLGCGTLILIAIIVAKSTARQWPLASLAIPPKSASGCIGFSVTPINLENR